MGDGSSSAPLTLAQTKAIVDGLPTNSDVVVAFIPDSSGEESEYSDGPDAAAETIVPSDWVIDGGVEKETAAVEAGGSRTVPYLGPDPRARLRAADLRRRGRHLLPEAGKPEPVEPTVDRPGRA